MTLYIKCWQYFNIIYLLHLDVESAPKVCYTVYVYRIKAYKLHSWQSQYCIVVTVSGQNVNHWGKMPSILLTASILIIISLYDTCSFLKIQTEFHRHKSYAQSHFPQLNGEGSCVILVGVGQGGGEGAINQIVGHHWVYCDPCAITTTILVNLFVETFHVYKSPFHLSLNSHFPFHHPHPTLTPPSFTMLTR